MLVTWRYRARKSLMEKFDPRARWIFSLAFLFAVTMFWDARFLFFFFLLAFGWYFSASIRWKEIRRGWYFIGFILFIMIFVNTIITGGGAGGVVPEGGHLVWNQPVSLPWDGQFIIGLTWERLWFAICQVLRIGSVSAVFLIIPYSMDPRLYGVTFRGLGLPDRFAYSMELAFRYVPTLARDFGTTLDAQRARGYEIEKVKGGIIKKIIRIAPLIVPITMNSILTGEDVVNAMDLRCFGTHRRTWLYEMKYHWYDLVLLAISFCMLVGGFIALRGFHIGGFWVPNWWLNLAK